MANKRKKRKTKFNERMENAVRFISPRWALIRKKYQFAYDAIDGTNTRKKRTGLGGTGDTQLTERTLYNLREICRELMRNNPFVKGMLKKERNGVIGSGVIFQARTADEGWNKNAEALWKEEMHDQTCDVTGRYNFNQYLRMKFLSYRRDGDAATIWLDDDTLQGIEGDQIGNPYRLNEDPAHYEIVNGIAVSKKTKKVIGYYIGQPNVRGYISPQTYQMYEKQNVWLMADYERFTQSRGEPVLTPSIDYIDKLNKYMDAELVAAVVNACYTMFISRKEGVEGPPEYTEGSSSTGQTPEGKRLEKIGHGTILYGENNESATGIGQTRPGAMFDPFVMKMLSIISRPLLMPLMIVTGDYSGATFMNARIAYQDVQDAWKIEQETKVKTFCSAVWLRKVNSWIRRRELPERKDMFAHDVQCRRWPYVNPLVEAKAFAMEVELGTETRAQIIVDKGRDPNDVQKQWLKEREEYKEPQAGNTPPDDDKKNLRKSA